MFESKRLFPIGYDSSERIPGIRYNHQDPSVSEKDLINGGCSLWNDTDVYNAQGKYVGKFEDVEWGYGASGLLIIDHVPITERPVPVRRKP